MRFGRDGNKQDTHGGDALGGAEGRGLMRVEQCDNPPDPTSSSIRILGKRKHVVFRGAWSALQRYWQPEAQEASLTAWLTFTA